MLRLVQERAYPGTGIVMPLLMAYRKEVTGLRFNFQDQRHDRLAVDVTRP